MVSINELGFNIDKLQEFKGKLNWFAYFDDGVGTLETESRTYCLPNEIETHIKERKTDEILKDMNGGLALYGVAIIYLSKSHTFTFSPQERHDFNYVITHPSLKSQDEDEFYYYDIKVSYTDWMNNNYGFKKKLPTSQSPSINIKKPFIYKFGYLDLDLKSGESQSLNEQGYSIGYEADLIIKDRSVGTLNVRANIDKSNGEFYFIIRIDNHNVVSKDFSIGIETNDNRFSKEVVQKTINSNSSTTVTFKPTEKPVPQNNNTPEFLFSYDRLAIRNDKGFSFFTNGNWQDISAIIKYKDRYYPDKLTPDKNWKLEHYEIAGDKILIRAENKKVYLDEKQVEVYMIMRYDKFRDLPMIQYTFSASEEIDINLIIITKLKYDAEYINTPIPLKISKKETGFCLK